MLYRLRTLLTQFTIRDVLWLTAVIGLIVVWRSDVAREEATYRDMLRTRMGSNREVRKILIAAKNHPELLTELSAFDADDRKNVSERVSLNRRYYDLVDKATNLYRRDEGLEPVP